MVTVPTIRSGHLFTSLFLRDWRLSRTMGTFTIILTVTDCEDRDFGIHRGRRRPNPSIVGCTAVGRPDKPCGQFRPAGPAYR